MAGDWHRKAAFCSRAWAVSLFVLSLPFLLGSSVRAQESPYFVTYSSALEEPGNLEISLKNVQGAPKFGNAFIGSAVEFEYGVLGWWTTEFYLDDQITFNDSGLFTGFRWENRFRLLPREHFINPVFYVEYENLNVADRGLLEVVGHDSIADLRIPNAAARTEVEREMELKLILSSNVRGWNLSENFVAEKELNETEPWEFGYAVGVSRPLSLVASGRSCLFCRENFAAGAEIYGGLSTADDFGLTATSHYLGPTASFTIPRGPTIFFSPQFGLNANSVGTLYRFSVSYEVQQLFHRKHF
ncbi:MAG TPA: hypothetical protein VLX11_00160 [Candidatus Acidoferrales bacterium]|nr:hypothetical protein [Candidatus Acidoferrales bacterium]